MIYSVKPGGLTSADYLAALAKRNVVAVPVDEYRVRMVTHLDVNRSDIETAVGAVREVMRKDLGAEVEIFQPQTE